MPHDFHRGMGQYSVARSWKEADFRIVFRKNAQPSGGNRAAQPGHAGRPGRPHRPFSLLRTPGPPRQCRGLPDERLSAPLCASGCVRHSGRQGARGDGLSAPTGAAPTLRRGRCPGSRHRGRPPYGDAQPGPVSPAAHGHALVREPVVKYHRGRLGRPHDRLEKPLSQRCLRLAQPVVVWSLRLRQRARQLLRTGDGYGRLSTADTATAPVRFVRRSLQRLLGLAF